MTLTLIVEISADMEWTKRNDENEPRGDLHCGYEEEEKDKLSCVQAAKHTRSMFLRPSGIQVSPLLLIVGVTYCE